MTELTPEVIAAAERLNERDPACYQGPTGDDTDMRAAILLARFITSQQQEAAERDKPIDEEWLRSIGFEEAHDKSLCLDCLQAWITGDGGPEWEWTRSIVRGLTTRGELLDLLKVLKIQAKGSE